MFAGISRAAGAITLYLGAMQCAAQAPLDAPNIVVITPHLVTSGQPRAPELAALKAKGFDAVINLAPPTAPDAVPEEGAILERQAMAYASIPVGGDSPAAADFERFLATMRALEGRRVLVHCQYNMGASAFVFLYRAIVLKDDPREAYASVSRIWTPYPSWKAMMERELRKNGIPFEIL